MICLFQKQNEDSPKPWLPVTFKMYARKKTFMHNLIQYFKKIFIAILKIIKHNDLINKPGTRNKCSQAFEKLQL